MRIRVAAIGLLVLLSAGAASAQTPSSSSPSTNGWGPTRVRIGIDAGIEAGTPKFTEQETPQIYAEDAPITVSFGSKSALLVDGSVAFHLTGRFGVGVAVSYARSKVDGQVHAEIPNPFYFNQPRTVDGTASGLPRVEVGTHVQMLYLLPVTPKFDVMLSGGPSLVTLQQDLVTTINFSESYPYDTATYESANLVRVRRTGFGFNVGADLTWHLSRMLGVGAMLRYTRASLSLPISGQPSVSAKAGGAQAGVGVKLFF